MFQYIRSKVSGDRKRTKEGDYDLDITYITPRIIAMSYPGQTSLELLYRNPATQVNLFSDRRWLNSLKNVTMTISGSSIAQRKSMKSRSLMAKSQTTTGLITTLLLSTSCLTSWLKCSTGCRVSIILICQRTLQTLSSFIVCQAKDVLEL